MKRIEKTEPSIRAARKKEKRHRRKLAEDDAPVEPVVIKSPSRRYERPKDPRC